MNEIFTIGLSDEDRVSVEPSDAIHGDIVQEQDGDKSAVLPDKKKKSGLGCGLVSFFMVTQMAGAGFLALPKAVSDTGWTGVALILLFGLSIGFSSSRLGRCWVILEERWEEYRKPAREPYMEIAQRALGANGRRLAFFSMMVTLTGSTIVFIIMIAGMMNTIVPALSPCTWSLIVTGIILPAIWPGRPKDFWQASVLALLVTVVAVGVIIGKLLIEREEFLEADPQHSSASISSFPLGLGAILFSFGGVSVFPTIQNDMKIKEDFWKSVIISFSIVLLMYVPVGAIGFALIGDSVKNNVLLSIGQSVAVTIAICLQIINLLATFIISINPVVQSLEEIIGVPREFGWKRVCLRTSVIIFQLLVVLAIPNFSLILNLIGGSTISCLSFILPGLMYMKLVDDKSDPSWPERKITVFERSYLWIIVIIGTIGGISATVSAVRAIVQPSSHDASCFVDFMGSKT